MWHAAVSARMLLVLAVLVGVNTGVALTVADLAPDSAPAGNTINWFDYAPHLAQQLPVLRQFAGYETAAAVEQLLDRGIVESPWADLSPSERTQQVKLHLGDHGKRYRAERRARKSRRLQTSAQEEDASISTYLNATEHVSCTDPLATNNGAARGCVYDCRTLQEEFFPGEESRCFMYDATTATWPDELLNLRQPYIYMSTFVSSEDGTNPPAEGVNFNVGAGRQCENVTIHTFFHFGTNERPEEAAHTEVRCLLDGEHEYNHTFARNHSVEVVGYAQSAVHVDAGGTTSFVIGECTDVVLRVTTTVDAGPVTWRVDDGGHNGPWDFNVPGGTGVHELESCMFDNDYTLVRVDGMGWQGSAEVIGFIRYHNTIEIPNDENWIIQGGIDVSTSLPASLDGRLSSGTPVSPSQANIILRDMRFSGRTAPIDPFPEWRQSNIQGRLGGAFQYTGGSDDPSNLPRLIFERVIFDHNVAETAGAAVYIDGRAGLPVPSDPSQTNWDSGISWTMRGCTFFRNHVPAGSAATMEVDLWPEQILFEDVDYIQNVAFLGQHDYHWKSLLPAPDRRRTGESWFRQKRCHFDGGWSTEGTWGIMPSTYISQETADDPEAVTNVTFEGTTVVDHAMVLWGFTQFVGSWPPRRNAATRFNFHVTDENLIGNIMLTAGDQFDSAFFNDPGHHTLVESSRFEANGPVVPGSIGTGGWGIFRSADQLPENWPTVRFVNTEFTHNRGAHGAAVGIIDGAVDVFFERCILRGNTATRSGGAISFGASPLSSLLVERSIFESNVVSIAQSDEATIAAVVVVNTGGLGEGSQDIYGGYHLPIWRIDNGPVYGAPWEMCEAAKQYSLDAVTRGFAEIWPSELECANVTYHTQATYSQVELVTNGVHTLFHGVITQGSQIITHWMKGSIEVVDVAGPVFPTFRDFRQEHLPDCNVGGSCGTPAQPEPPDCSGNDCCCKKDVSMWSSTDFFISAGTGGGIDVRGSVHIAISDSEFRNNDAPQGASLRISSTLSTRITNTSIDEPMDEWSSAISAFGAAVATCVDNPCAAGSSCTFTGHSTMCAACAPNEIGVDGISCLACPPGTEPNDEQSECLQCEAGRASTIGVCMFCAAGKTGSTDRKACIPCQPGTRRGAEEGECVQCPSGTQTADSIECRTCPPGASPNEDRDGCTTCEAGKHSVDGIECTSCDAGSQPSALLTGCDSCSLSGPNAYSTDGVACRDCPARNAPNYERTGCFCKVGTYNAVELGVVTCHGTSFRSLDIETDECAVCPPCMDCSVIGKPMLQSGWAFFGANQAFRCPGADEFEACPALPLNSNATMDSSTCTIGYEGPVCGNCQEHYNHLKVGNPCDSCNDNVLNVPLIVGLLVGGTLFGVAFVSGAMGTLSDHGVITDVRILIGFYQILGQAGNVLDLTFPTPIPAILRYVKLLFLDVRALVKLDCMDVGGLYGKIVTNVVVVPLAVVIICFLMFEAQRRSLNAVIAAGAADKSAFVALKVKLKHNLFLGIFLVYPCQHFGEASFHEDDYNIDCTTTTFMLTKAAAVLVIIFVPIGIPAMFAFLMARAKQSLGGIVNETATGGAKLSSDDVEEEEDQFAFLTEDYHPKYYYYEIITYSKKLTLSGISVLVGRGTVAQIYFVISAEAFYLMHHVRTFPFVLHKHNVLEAFGHQSLLLMYAITLILRYDDETMWRQEWFPKEGYGWFLAFVAVFVLPSPIVYYYYKDTRRVNGNTIDSDEILEENPLSQPVRSMNPIFDDKGSELRDMPPSRVKLAKMQRQSKTMREQNQKTQSQLLQLQSEAESAKAEIASLRAQLAQEPPLEFQQSQTGTVAIKEFAADEDLGEEIRESAKQAVDEMVAVQIMQSKNEMLRAKFTSTTSLAALGSFEEHHKEMMKYLKSLRLLHHADVVIRVAGMDAVPSDLQYLSEENIEELAGAMTHIEMMRFQGAMQALTGDQASIVGAVVGPDEDER